MEGAVMEVVNTERVDSEGIEDTIDVYEVQL